MTRFLTLAVIVIAISVPAVLLYVAWLNRLFLRCPHCRKIGTWRFDPAGPETCTTEPEQDGAIESTRQLRVCRKCGNKVLDVWSDHGGRSLEKVGG